MFLGIICPRKKRQSFLSQTHLKLRNMSKAEKYIIEHTRNCSNLMQVPTLDDKGNIVPEAHSWLTPDQARMAVEIAKEEMIEKACDVIRHKYGHYHYLRGDITEELIKEFVKAIKDE